MKEIHVALLVSGVVVVGDEAIDEMDPSGETVQLKLDVLPASFKVNSSMYGTGKVPAEVLMEAARALIDYAAHVAPAQAVREPESGPTQPGGQA